MGSAYLFDGSTGSILVNGSSSLDVGAGGGLTVAAWLKPSDISTYRPVLEWGDTPQPPIGAHFWLGCCWDDSTGWAVQPGALIANLVDVNGGWHLFSTPCNVSVPVLAQDVWQHVAWTYDKASHTAVIYLNGAQVATKQFDTTFDPQTGSAINLHIGARPLEGRYYAGSMDEVRVYDRALSAGEVAGLASVVCR